MTEEPLQNTKRYLKHRSFGQAHPAAYKIRPQSRPFRRGYRELLPRFRLYEDCEFDDLAEFLGDGSDPREYAAENYSGQLFLYLKRNMTDAMILEGDDGTGKEPFSMTDELFHYPACMISCRIEELLSDNFTLCLENEIWMLENGEFASVYCVSLTNGTGRLSYRFLDTYIKNPWDIPVSFDDLESSFAKIAEAVEEGRAAELP